MASRSVDLQFSITICAVTMQLARSTRSPTRTSPAEQARNRFSRGSASSVSCIKRYDTCVDLHIVRRRAQEGCGALGAGLHPVLQRVYAARGIQSAAQLSPALERMLSIGTLEGVSAATELLLTHRERGRVLVIGDFDADGATSTALVVRALRAWGFASADFLVPNRFEFGYGLTPEIVQLAVQRDPTLIITVDNGISSAAGVAAARACGIDVLITDHHLPGAEMPDANVIVNPNLAGASFASRALAGVGVAFYVMAGVWHRSQERGLLA